jgi:hypothetical protein
VRRGPALAVVAAGALALGGCHGGQAAAVPPGQASGSAANAGEQLSGIEVTVDAIERQVDSDGAG